MSAKHEWFQTVTGRQFYPTLPYLESISILDIAFGLSHIARFGGHVPGGIYTVAQHSVMVSHHVPDSLRLAALLHDATEAYLGDMIRPLKVAMPEYKAVEAGLEAMIAQKFGFTWPLAPEIKVADNRALATERRDLLRPRAWANSYKPFEERIEIQSSKDAFIAFMERFVELAGPVDMDAEGLLREADYYITQDQNRFSFWYGVLGSLRTKELVITPRPR